MPPSWKRPDAYKWSGPKWHGILQLLLRALFENNQMETNVVSPDYQKHQHLHNTSKFTIIVINRPDAIYTHLHHFYSKGTGSAKCFPVQQRTLRGQEQSRSSCPKFPAYWLYYPLITGSGSTQLCAVEKLLHNECVRFKFPSYFHIHKSCFEWQMSIRIGRRFSILTIFFSGRSTYQVLVRADYVYEFISALRSKKSYD